MSRREEAERLQLEEEDRQREIEESQPQPEALYCPICGMDYIGLVTPCGVTRCLTEGEEHGECMRCGEDIPIEKQLCHGDYCILDEQCIVEECPEMLSFLDLKEGIEACEIHRPSEGIALS